MEDHEAKLGYPGNGYTNRGGARDLQWAAESRKLNLDTNPNRTNRTGSFPEQGKGTRFFPPPVYASADKQKKQQHT